MSQKDRISRSTSSGKLSRLGVDAIACVTSGPPASLSLLMSRGSWECPAEFGFCMTGEVSTSRSSESNHQFL